MNDIYGLLSSILIITILFFLLYLFVFRKQNKQLNWSIFFSGLYILCILPVANYLCVQWNLWEFNVEYDNEIHIPYDLFFIWLFMWSVAPIILFKGKFPIVISFVLFWIDLLFMPFFETLNIIELNKHWLLGEIFLIGTVFLPAYIWAKSYLYQINLGLRALFQVVVMTSLFLLCLQFILQSYQLIKPVEKSSSIILSQLMLIIAFPSLVAVQNMVTKGKGTPFPYDPTKYLVRSSVYAYIKNPIQWSFTLIFIPLSVYYQSFIFAIASFISVAYVYGVSKPQEYPDMFSRFGKGWSDYRKQVPSWYFTWKPNYHPKGRIYFDHECQECNQLKQWFQEKKSVNLKILDVRLYPSSIIEQATYVDELGNEYKSVAAIGQALNHIHLGYASLGWFIQFPGINSLLQAIIDSMDLGNQNSNCSIEAIKKD